MTIMRFFRGLLRPLLNSDFVKKSHQRKALRKVDAISKGEIKVTAPKYPTEKKILTAPDEEARIKKVLQTKNESLIEKIDKMTITSVDPPKAEIPIRKIPKQTPDYLNINVDESEYGFFEPPEDRIEKNKLKFREAIELLRARMELGNDSSPDLSLFEATNSYIEGHPAVKRVDKEKLERVWQYFRPFALRREQKLMNKEDLATIERYIEGSDDTITPSRKELRAKIKRAINEPQMSRGVDSKESQEEFEAQIRERQEKEIKRLQKRMEKLKEMENEMEKRHT